MLCHRPCRRTLGDRQYGRLSAAGHHTGCRIGRLPSSSISGCSAPRLASSCSAAVDNPNAARLMSIDVTLTHRADVMRRRAACRDRRHPVAPLFNVAYDMGTLFGIKAFAVAILGGLTNPWGVVVAGLGYGLVEALPPPGSDRAARRW